MSRIATPLGAASLLLIASACNERSREHLEEAGERLEGVAESLDNAAKESLGEGRENLNPSSDR